MSKPAIHMSEAEAANDLLSLLARVRAGAEVVIERDAEGVAVIRPAAPQVRLLSESLRLAKDRVPTRRWTAVSGATLIVDGVKGSELKDRMADLQNRKEALLKQLEMAAEPPPLLHPSMADLYRTKIEDLSSALQREDTRLEASEMLRGLIDSIVLTPEDRELRIELRGNLAAMLAAAQQTKRSPQTDSCRFNWLPGHATNSIWSSAAPRPDVAVNFPERVE
jgi:antitoxin (DNA-binding transcriptional repressor) of toxin-antitoxin stability system